jgi:hypothetical protein
VKNPSRYQTISQTTVPTAVDSEIGSTPVANSNATPAPPITTIWMSPTVPMPNTLPAINSQGRIVERSNSTTRLVYSIVFAALGALISRQEDVGGAIMLVLMVVIAGYVVGISVLPTDPGNALAEALSVIPLFAPTLMPTRLAIGGVPVWEAGLSVALVVALIPVLIWFAGRIYRNTVLRTGAKVKLRDALKSA